MVLIMYWINKILSEKKENSWHFYDVTSWGKFSCFLIGTGKKWTSSAGVSSYETELNGRQRFYINLSVWPRWFFIYEWKSLPQNDCSNREVFAAGSSC